MTHKEYKKKNGFIVIKPEPDSVVLAQNKMGVPVVWAVKLKPLSMFQKWIVVQNFMGTRYMKHSGEFTLAESITPKDPREDHTYPTWQKAANAFKKHYAND